MEIIWDNLDEVLDRLKEGNPDGSEQERLHE
jgi:hypothetical protein